MSKRSEEPFTLGSSAQVEGGLRDWRIFLEGSSRPLCASSYALFLYTTSPAMRSTPITPMNIHSMSIKKLLSVSNDSDFSSEW